MGTRMSSRDPLTKILIEFGKGLTKASLTVDRVASVSEDCFIIV